MSLQMAQFCPFIWLSNIPLYMCVCACVCVCVCVPHLLDPFLWTFRSLPCPKWEGNPNKRGYMYKEKRRLLALPSTLHTSYIHENSCIHSWWPRKLVNAQSLNDTKQGERKQIRNKRKSYFTEASRNQHTNLHTAQCLEHLSLETEPGLSSQWFSWVRVRLQEQGFKKACAVWFSQPTFFTFLTLCLVSLKLWTSPEHIFI